MLKIYTDGSNIHNGKPWSYGGCAYVICYPDRDPFPLGKSYSIDLNQPVTNNRMELLGVIHGMEFVLKLEDEYIPEKLVCFYSDSMLTVNGCSDKWKHKTNRDLWMRFRQLKMEFSKRGIKFDIQWVKGHVGNPMNELADETADKYCRAVAVDVSKYKQETEGFAL